MSWLKKPVAHMTTLVMRMRFYVIAVALVAASVPFLHLYMDDQLSFTELLVHTLSVAFSTVIAIALFELILWLYLKKRRGSWNVSIGLFWLSLFGVFVLAFIVMSVTHDFLPVTLDIWDKHIKNDIVAEPWKILPIILLVGYILIQLIRHNQYSQELADLKQLNEQLQARKAAAGSSNNGAKEKRHLEAPRLVLPCKGEDLSLNPALIIRVESNENYCHVLVAPDEEQNEHCYMARITLNEVANQLPESLFLQVHRSHIVNFTYVSSLVRQDRNYKLRLTNGDNIPVSRSRIKQIRQKVLGAPDG